MNRIAIATAAALLGSLALDATASGPPDAGEREVYTYAVSLDSAGRVTALEPVGDVPPAAAAVLDRQVRGWLFQPLVGNGGAHVDTWLRITTRTGADGLHVESATTGPAPRAMTIPEYPRAAQRRGEAGVVVMRMTVDAQGRVTDATAYDTGARPSRALAQAARDAALAWQFHPERVNGKPVASTVLLPMCFLTGEPTPQTCSWSGPQSKRFSRHTVLTLEPAARLKGELALGD